MAKVDKKNAFEGEIQLVAFKLRKEEYGFSILTVQEIKGLTDITRVPFASDFIEGVINLRGSVLPVVDLKKRIGLEATDYTPNTRIVIVKTDDISVGMIVDEVTEVITLDAENIEPIKTVNDTDGSRFMQGIGKLGDRLIIMLDLEEIIGLSGEAK